MSINKYDPDTLPAGGDWLSTSEAARLQLVADFHTGRRIKAGSPKAHASIHVMVENQIAMESGATVRAMVRLQQGGLSRHDAVHAIGSVIAKQLYGILSSPSDPETAGDAQPQVDAAIDALDAQAWLDSHAE